MNPHRSLFIFFVVIFYQISALPAPLPAQPFKLLYLPDSLGGCADFDTLFYNPRTNEVYVWSGRAGNLGVLDASTGERKRPWVLDPPYYLTWNQFALNPVTNRMYTARTYGGRRDDDTFAVVYDCSTRSPVETLFVNRNGMEFQSNYLSVNTASDQFFWSVSLGGVNRTYIFDAQTGELRKIGPAGPFIQHPCRPVAYQGHYSYSITVWDCTTDSIIDSIAAPPGFRRFNFWVSMIAPDSELLFVAGDSEWMIAQHLFVISCRNNQIIGRLRFADQLASWACCDYNPFNNKLYVATNTKTFVIDPVRCQIVDSLGDRGALYYNPVHNLLFRATVASDFIDVFDGATNQLVAQIQAPGSDGVMIPEVDKLFLREGGGNIVMVDCCRLQLERYFKMGYGNQALTLNPNTERLYVNDVMRDTMSSILVVYDAHTLQPLGVRDYRHQVDPAEWFYDLCPAPPENKIYLTSGKGLGVYVINGEQDSLIHLIPCDAGGHQLVYSWRSNRMFVCPFTQSGYLHIIDCADDRVVASYWIDEGPVDGYLNSFNELLYCPTGTNPSFLCLFDTCGTMLKRIRGLGNPVVFRNRGDIHQVYIAAHQDTCLYVFDPSLVNVIDTVQNVPVYERNFAYYDSIDDRIYYPAGNPLRMLVIDCGLNKVVDSIMFPPDYGNDNFAIFYDIGFWNPVSNRLYWLGSIIDCRMNRIIAEIPVLAPTRTAWNEADNIVFVNDHWRAKVVAVRDNLIGCDERGTDDIISSVALLLPSLGNRFVRGPGITGEIRVFDAAGRAVKNIRPKQQVFDARSFVPGIYFATATGFDGTRRVQKFTVIR
ncbi:MAG: hypothetical protein ABIK11_01590 [candidate division WOR-3 bacterium]